MPANRSRTERWRDCLHQIYERNGGLEFSVAHGPEGRTNGADLVWRVRILKLSDDEILVERPAAFGQSFPIDQGLNIVGVMAIGQNRWMFHSRTLGMDNRTPGGALRLAMPTTVERCRRRDFYRISTAELSLPGVQCWPLLDPTSVVAAEVANRAAILDLESGRVTLENKAPDMLPEVGPGFASKLMNIGGGGVGLLVDRNEASRVDSSRLLWVRVDLTPAIPAPVGLTARVVHVHRDSEQNLYVGAAFEFAFHAAHRDFVISQIARYVTQLQVKQRVAA